jgi:hypothetical protein
MPLSDADFQTRVDLARAAPIHVEAMNSLIPANLKVVGPEVDISPVSDYFKRLWPARKHWVREWLYLPAETYRTAVPGTPAKGGRMREDKSATHSHREYADPGR